MIFGIKENDPYNVLLAIATNILVRLMTGFVVQRHKYNSILYFYISNVIDVLIIRIN